MEESDSFELTVDILSSCLNKSYRFLKASNRYDSSGVMGGVCKVWFIIHRNILIYDY